MAEIENTELRILVLGDSRSFHIDRYVYALRQQGCHVLLASLEQGGTRHFPLKHRGVFRVLHYALAASEVMGLVKRFNPDIINPHFASGYGFTTALAHVRKVAPVLLHLWGSDVLIVPNKSMLHRRKTSYALSHSDHIIADSRYILEQAGKIARLPECSVIPWGIDRDHLKFHKSDYTLRRPLRIIVPRPHEIVYNNPFIVRALDELVHDGRVELTFPSFGSLTDDFHMLADSLLGNRIHYYDRMDRRSFLQFMSGFDVYLSAAISDSSPASLIETMGLGLIPVTADIPGVKEWMGIHAGFVYQAYQLAHLKETILKLVSGSNDYHEMRQTNLARVKREALFEDNMASTLQIMRQLIEARRT